MRARQLPRPRRFLIRYRLKDGPMLTPEPRPGAVRLDDRHHDTAQLVKMRLQRRTDKGVPGQSVDVLVKSHIAADEITDIPVLDEVLALSDNVPGFGEVFRSGALGGKTGRCLIERRAQLIHVANLVGAHGGNDQTAAAGLTKKALRFEQHERLHHRLARYAEPLGDLFLREACARLHFAVADRVPDGDIDRIEDAGSVFERFHRLTLILNAVFNLACLGSSERSEFLGSGALSTRCEGALALRYACLLQEVRRSHKAGPPRLEGSSLAVKRPRVERI